MALRPLILLLVFLTAGTRLYAQSSAIYVDVTNGSDTYTGLNPANTPPGTGPKSTIHAGLTSVANGGRLIIFAGTYPGDGVDTDGSPGTATDNADIEISALKYPNITSGLTIELRSLGTNNEIKIEPEANSVLAANGALITHSIDDYIPNFVVNLPGATLTVVATNETGFLSLTKRSSNDSSTSSIIHKAGFVKLSNSSFVRLRSGAAIAIYGAAGFSDQAPAKGTDLNLSYFADASITAGPEARYGNFGAGVLTVNKISGSSVTFAAPMTFAGAKAPAAGVVSPAPNKAIVLSSGTAIFQSTVSLGTIGATASPPTLADIVANGSASAIFNGSVSFVVGAAGLLGDYSISSIENLGTGSLAFNGPVKWNAASNASGAPLASLTFNPGPGTALVRNASSGAVRFASTVTLTTDSVAGQTGDAYFSVCVQNDDAGTLSFDQGISAPNTTGLVSGNRNFSVHALNAASGTLNISGTIRGSLSNTGFAGGTININGPTAVSSRIVNATGKTIALGSNTLLLMPVTGPPFLNDGSGGLTTPSPLNNITNGGLLTTTTGALRLSHTSGDVTFNGGTFGTLKCDGIGGTTQLINNRVTIDNLLVAGGSLSTLTNTIVSGPVSLSSGVWTLADGVSAQAGSFVQSGGVCNVGGGISGNLKIVGSFLRSAGDFSTGAGSLIEISGTAPQTVDPGVLFQVYDIVFNNSGGTITLGKSIRASHSVTITPGSILDLGSNDLIINGDSATVTNGGSVVSDAGSLVFGGSSTIQSGRSISGAVFNSAGSGLCSSLRIDVGTSNRLRSNGTVRITRLLDLRSGTLEIVSGDISPSGQGVRVVHDVGASKQIVSSGGTFSGSGVAYDLEYAGTLSSTTAASMDLNGNVRSWTISAISDPNLDGDNDLATGTTYFVEIPGAADFVLGGLLTVGRQSAVRIAPSAARVSFILGASGVSHTIRGILTTADADDNIAIGGGGVTLLGSTSGTEPSLLGNTIISSAGECAIRNIHGFIGNLTAGAGSLVTLRMGSSAPLPGKLASEQVITGALTLNGTSFTLASGLEVQRGVAFNVGTLNLDVHNLTLTTSGDFVQSSGSSGFTSSGGFLVMNRSGASLTIGDASSKALPNLRILANTTLTGPGRISGSLEVGTPASVGMPILSLGKAGNDLTVAGSVITFTSDGSGNGTAIVADGTSDGTVGGKLVIVNPSSLIIANTDITIEELSYNPTGGSGTLNFVSSGILPRIFSVGDILTQVAGDINIGSNHLVLQGTGGGPGARSYNRTAGSIFATTGEVRFEGAAAQQFSPGSNLTIPNLKINNTSGILSSPSTEAFTVSGKLDLVKGALGINQGKLVIGDDVTIIRRSNGSLISSPPTFGRRINVWYIVDQLNGNLTTHNELPADSAVLKDLRINNPNPLPAQAGVVLSRAATVHGTLFLDAGSLVQSSYDVTIDRGSTIEMGGGRFDPSGGHGGVPIVSTYNVVYRAGTSIVSTSRELQEGSGIRANVSVFSASEGQPTTLVLHANRTVGDVIIDSEVGGFALGPANSIAARNLSITGNVTVRSGAFLSSTGIASLIDLVGTTEQSITVPRAGLLLPGGASSINLRLKNPAGFTLQGGNLTLDHGVVLFFVNGVMRTGQNAVVLTQTPGGQGFDRSGIVRPNLSHILGKVRHTVIGGAGSPAIHPNGRYEFPVGSATRYRPFAITFASSYPAINTTTIDVEHEDGNPAGILGFPLDGGNGVRVGNRSSYSWIVTTGPTGLASNQRYDVEFQTADLIYLPPRVQDLRAVRRRETGGAQNTWTLQGSGASYYGNDVVVSESGDSTFVVRSAYSNEALTSAGARFAIGVPSRPPVFLRTLGDTTIVENQRLDFPYLSDPLDLGESIRYSLINPPSGATIDLSSGAFAWKPSFGQAGSYSVVVLASDGQFLTIATATVTVRRVNRPPVFALVLPDTAIRDTRDTLRFTYSAVDPEGDPVLFSLVSGPPGMTLSNLGVLRWVATPQQANRSYVVRVAVSDGIQSDSATATVTVTRNRSRGDVDGDGLITSNDASLVLRHVVGLFVLNDPGALFAADASRDGTITAYDASLILQAAVGLIVIPSFSRQSIEGFDAPPSFPVAQSTLGSLGWSSFAGPKASSTTAILLRLTSQKADVYSVEWNIRGDFSRCPVQSIVADLPQGWQVAEHLADGELRIAMVGTTPISGRELATVTVVPASGEGRIVFSASGMLNESARYLDPLEVSAVPAAFALRHNYPNPFNPGTTIEFQLPEKSSVSLVIYNLQGQKIRTLLDGIKDAGTFDATWDGRNDAGDLVSSGSYICRMQAGTFTANQRMLLIR